MRIYSAWFWNGWTDEKEEGTFRNIYTGEKMPEELWNNFPPGDPDGGTSENCLISFFEGDQMFMTDFSCNDAWSVAFCELEDMPRPTMRGLYFHLNSCLPHDYLDLFQVLMTTLTYPTPLIHCNCKHGS